MSFSGNARYGRAAMLKLRLERPEYRLKPDRPQPRSAHVSLIERLWGNVRRHATHSRRREAFQKIAAAIFELFDRTLPDSRESLIDETDDGIRVISRDGRLVVG